MKALALTQSSGVLQVLRRGLGRWLRLRLLWIFLLWRLFLWLVLDGLIVLHGVAQLSALGAVSIPRVDTSGAGSVVNSSADTFEPEGGGLSVSLVHASVENAAVTAVCVVSVARTFVGPGDSPLKV